MKKSQVLNFIGVGEEMKNNFLKYLFLFVIVFLISFIYKVFIMPVTGDEIWVYGFSYNITKGLMIYRDFNVILTPFYFFLSSLFIQIFGNYLVSLHIFDCILLGFLMIMVYKKLGFCKSLIFYLFVLFNYFPTYSYFCLFLLFVIIYLLDEKKEVSFSVIAFLCGLIFITKQSIGLFMIVPLLFYSKNKLRDLLVFIFPFVIVIIYLTYHRALFDFINYCFLGMFDFGGSNLEFSIFFIFELVLCGYLLYKLIKTKFLDKRILFVFMFQINIYPIFDIQHFLEVLLPVFYLFLDSCNIYKLRFYYRFLLVASLYVIFICYIVKCIIFLDYSISLDKSSFLYLRNNSSSESYILEKTRLLSEYIDDYDEYYFLFVNNYAIKLYNNMDIDKYDLLFDGNLGYHGDIRVIQKINNNCKKNSCVFLVDKIKFKKYVQFSRKIYDYVLGNYNYIDENDYFMVYDNQKNT